MESTPYVMNNSTSVFADTLSGMFGFGTMFASLIVFVFVIAIFWKLYTKAGYNGWAAIIPFYCNYKYSMMTFGSWIPFVLTFVPVVNGIALIAMLFKTAIVFGKSAGFGILTVFFPYICIPILAFGSAEYVGPDKQY